MQLQMLLLSLSMYILHAVYIAIDTDQLMKEINMILSVIKANEPNIKNVMSLSIVIDIFNSKANSV